MTYPHLENAPVNHCSPEFLDYLRENNTVVWENDQWLVIENCKYHTADQLWLTAFLKELGVEHERDWYDDVDILYYKFTDFHLLVKPEHKRSVRRPHVHLVHTISVGTL